MMRTLVIGIPTVFRAQNYLAQTTKSLLANCDDIGRIRIMVMDFTDGENPNLSGLDERIRLQRFRGGYPALEGLSGNFGDAPGRTRWRAKQCFDAGAMIEWCAGHGGDYYLHLEDDVIATNGYDTRIFAAIDGLRSKEWSCIQFHKGGFIAQLFHAEDLPKLSSCARRSTTRCPWTGWWSAYAPSRAGPAKQ